MQEKFNVRQVLSRRLNCLNRIATSHPMFRKPFFFLSKRKFYFMLFWILGVVIWDMYLSASLIAFVLVSVWVIAVIPLQFRSLGVNSCFSLTSGWRFFDNNLCAHMSSKLSDDEFRHNKIVDDLMTIVANAEEFHFHKIDLTSFLLSDDLKRDQIRLRLMSRLERRFAGKWSINDCGTVGDNWKSKLDFICLKITIPKRTAKNHFIFDERKLAGKLEIVRT
jgi:hypothetical protein